MLMDNIMKIMMYVNDLGLGGVQIIAIEKLINFKKLGHEVSLITRENGLASKFLDENSIPLTECKDKESVINTIKEFGPDILHGHSCGGGSEAISFGKELGIVCGETIHSMVPGNKVGDFEVVYNELNSSIRPDSTLIYWGFMTDRITPTMTRDEARDYWEIPKNVYVIGRNGRLDGSKAPKDFIETLKYLPDWVWGLVGGWGPEMDNLQRQASNLGIRERVIFTGARYDVANVIAAMDCVVYPTLDESFCAGVVEPMYQRKPVVCYVRGGMIQHTIHEETALVGNDPGELAKYVAKLIKDTELAAKLGDNAYNKCNQLGYWDAMRDAKEHIELYERHLS